MATETKKIVNIVDTYANIDGTMASNQTAFSSNDPSKANGTHIPNISDNIPPMKRSKVPPPN